MIGLRKPEFTGLLFVFSLCISGCLAPFPKSKYFVQESETPGIELKWKILLPAFNIESRLIPDESREQIYFMTDSAVLAVNVAAGEVVWEKAIRGVSPAGQQFLHLSANSLITTDNKGRIVHARSPLTGESIWEADFGFHRQVRFFASDESRVYLAQNFGGQYTYLVALDLRTGNRIWEHSERLFGLGWPYSLHLQDERLFVETNDVWEFESSSGRLLNTYPSFPSRSNYMLWVDKIVHRGEKYIQSLRLSQTGHEEIWRFQDNACNGNMRLLPQSGSALELYLAGPCHTLIKLDATIGTEKWSIIERGWASGLLKDEKELYVLTSSSTIYHLNAAGGKILGYLQFHPRVRDRNGRQDIARIGDWLVVTNGNNELFGFRKVNSHVD